MLLIISLKEQTMCKLLEHPTFHGRGSNPTHHPCPGEKEIEKCPTWA